MHFYLIGIEYIGNSSFKVVKRMAHKTGVKQIQHKQKQLLRVVARSATIPRGASRNFIIIDEAPSYLFHPANEANTRNKQRNLYFK